MKSNLGHLQINIQQKNKAFYKDLFTFLGWTVLYEDENMVGVGCEKGSSLWFGAGIKDLANDYDGRGMNHLAVAVEKQTDVDLAVDYLKQHNILALFDTPRHRAEFSGPGNTYYQVMFESPDKLLFEVVYTGPKDK
jgi:catechol 2,3-dioxygenase-like lactoylglutathione lyase family enzyme